MLPCISVSEHVMKLLSKKADYHSDFRKQLQSHEEVWILHCL